VAATAPRTGGLAWHGRTWAGRQRVRARLGTPAVRPCDVRRTGCPAAAVPVLASLARTGARCAPPPFRSGRPWGPGCAWRGGRAGTTCGIRSYPAVRARPAPSLGRAVSPGPRPESGIGSRAEPGLLAAISPGICSRARPPAARPGNGIRSGSGAGPRAETRIGVAGAPRSRGVLRGLRPRRRGERYTGCRPIARCQAVAWCPRPARTRFQSTVGPGTRPTARIGTRDLARAATRNTARAGTRVRAQASTRNSARISARIPARAGAKTRIHARVGSRCGRAGRARIQARIAGWAQPWVQTGAPARPGPARRAYVAAKARVTAGSGLAAETWAAEAWVIGAQAAVAARVWARAQVITPGLLIPNVRIGRAAFQGRILIGASSGQAPARVPRGLRTAVAHAPLSSPRTPRRCRRDLLEVTPS
jgi:hypothetical protein